MSKLHIIIPARSGSVGVPDKNIATIGGVPLLLRAYRVARSLPFDSQVTVSTDSRRYLEMVAAEGYGPLALRPSKLSTSTSHVIDTVLYELDQAQASDDSLCLLLEPSFVGRRRPNTVEAMQRLLDEKADSCFGVYAVPPQFHFAKQYIRQGDAASPVYNLSNVNRQELNPSFVRSGEFYISRVAQIRKTRSLFGGRLIALITLGPFVNIDRPADMAFAQQIATEAMD